MRTRRRGGADERRQKISGISTFISFPTLVTIIALTLVTACSSQEQDRDYAVPDSLCGTSVNAEEITPFLPAGKSIEVTKEEHYATEICKVVVDETLILTATQAWVGQGKTTAYFASGQTLETPKLSAESGRYRFSGNEGFGKTRSCVDREHKQELYVALQFQGSKHSDSDAIEQLVTAYTEKVEDSSACTAGAQ
ncbi:hypothetical protein [Streptomyces sp. NPDC017260]|uniref:hypothetical protein n=1 Tax=unclassified Streptomyces TaxID=2593676 RepID=UPI0037BAEDAA